MAITVLPSDIQAVFPEFKNEDSGRMAALILMAFDFVSESVFAARTRTAIILYAAHMISSTSKANAGTAGLATSQKVGDLAAGYTALQGLSTLETTKYGQQYKRLRDMVTIGRARYIGAGYDPGVIGDVKQCENF